jgi:hypothetical protein
MLDMYNGTGIDYILGLLVKGGVKVDHCGGVKVSQWS